MQSSFKIDNRWFVIVNPVAGKGKGLTDWPIISTLLYEADIQFDALFTRHKYHATELTVYAVNRGYRKIIIVGGDGTIHEAVNALFIQEKVPANDVLLAVIAVGTGNDWVRMFGIPRTYSDAVRSIAEELTFLQDVGRATYWESQVQHTRYFANVAGIAFDAEVCKRFNRLKENGYRGRWLYVWSVLREALCYRCRKARVYINDREVFNNKLFSASIAIGKYTGGGLSQTPYAVPDDGLFDMTIIPKMNRLKLFSRFGTLYTYNIYNITGVTLQRADHIRVVAEGPIWLELDGETMGYSDFSFEIVPRSIKVIVSDKFLTADS